MDLLDRDKNLRIIYNDLINSECEKTKLTEIINYLINNYDHIFLNTMLPSGKNKAIYLADVIQFICATEA